MRVALQRVVGKRTLRAPLAVQATRFVYGADIVNESDHSVVSVSPTLVREIQYPDGSTGQPSVAQDVVTFRYTMGAQLAQRVDQRGVILDFEYGDCLSCVPHNTLTNVKATIPSNSAVDDAVIELRFTYDDKGQLTSANSYIPNGATANTIAYSYDAFGNLTSETYNPWGGTSYRKSINYTWEPTGQPNRNRVTGIKYHSGRQVNIAYGDSPGDLDDRINRPTAILTSSGQDIFRISYTGGGRVARKVWGDGIVTSDRMISADQGTGELAGTDPFGRVTRLRFDSIADTTAPFHQYSVWL